MEDYFIVAFYKAKFGDKKWVDDGISIYTTAVNVISLLCLLRFKMAWKVLKNRYSHAEAWWKIPERPFSFDIDLADGNGVRSKTVYCGEMFTSTMRDENNGTVIRDANGVLIHPERWDIMKIPANKENLDVAKWWARWQEKNNLGYSKKTIANFFNPFRPTQKPKENEQHICSVAVQGFCWKSGLFNKWRIWSPIKLW